jgi:hypothetical protein
MRAGTHSVNLTVTEWVPDSPPVASLPPIFRDDAKTWSLRHSGPHPEPVEGRTSYHPIAQPSLRGSEPALRKLIFLN